MGGHLHRKVNWELPHNRKKLDITFVMYGFPEVLVVINNVIRFISASFEIFVSHNQTMHETLTPYHPLSNSPTKRLVQTKKVAIFEMRNYHYQTPRVYSSLC